MFKNVFQACGHLLRIYKRSLTYMSHNRMADLTSLGSDPLQLWATHVGSISESSKKNLTAATSTSNTPSSNEVSTPSAPPEPHVEFLVDDTLNSQVLELLSTNLPSTFITTPSLATRTLGIKLPFLVFLVKNLGKYWSFEVTILDDRGEKRRFRASNFQIESDRRIVGAKF
ncbi:hypothetical protein BGX27_006421 [Mortierella sp. AM989]|nr:hypothetical protein BGX27_006421 [Mortierella sp. AM989]